MSNLVRRLGALVVSASAVGAAHADEGLYARFDLGAGGKGDFNAEGLAAIGGNNPVSALDTGGFETGFSQHASLGYGLGDRFRVEVEGARRENKLEPSVSLASGDVTATSAMVNGIVDFNPKGRIQPYVGAGIGYARLEAKAESRSRRVFTPPPCPEPVQERVRTIDDSDSGVAVQLLAGVGVKLTERATLDLGYRYFETPGLEFTAARRGKTKTDRFSADYAHQTATIGLRWRFGAGAPAAAAAAPAPPPLPPAAPVVAPAAAELPCRAQAFTIYFAWNRATLDAAALAEIERAVAETQRCRGNSAAIIGHADTSGPAQYNLRLSERRAAMVRDALLSRGVDPKRVVTRAVGETELAVQTQDNVREAGNRRSVVSIEFR